MLNLKLTLFSSSHSRLLLCFFMILNTFNLVIFDKPGASGTVRIDESGDRDPDYSLKYYVNGSFQNIADYNHSTGGFNLRGNPRRIETDLFSVERHMQSTPPSQLIRYVTKSNRFRQLVFSISFPKTSSFGQSCQHGPKKQ